MTIKYQNKFHQESGLTLLEALLSIIIITPLLCLMINLSRSCFKLITTGTPETSAAVRELRVRSFIQGIVFDLDTHYLELAPKIHKNSKISFADGAIHPGIRLSGARSPDNTSDAISAISLDLSSTLTVVQIQSVNPYIVLTCPRYSKRPEAEQENFIAISIDGIREVVAKAPRGSSALCREMRIENTKSLFIAQNNILKNARLLIPIKDNYTLFLDKSKTLRYLSHRGETIVENQPILNNIKALKFSLKYSEDSKLYTLRSTLSLEGRKTKRFSYSSILARRSYLHLMAHL